MTPEEVPAELVKLIKLNVGSPLPCMSHDETDDVYREILAFVLPEHEKQLTADRDRAREIAVALEQEVARVRDLHSPEDRGNGPHCKGCATHVTFTPWPCRTIRALDGGEAP